MFAQMMITHHEQAVEMAGLAATRASDAEVRSLAEQIKAAQEPEITRMRGWLKSWKAPESAGMPMGHGAGMMSDADMAGLKAAKGTAFDRKFAEMMIGHHRGAIDMAEDVRKNGRNEAVRQLTGKVITTQSAEVEQLQKIIDRIWRPKAVRAGAARPAPPVDGYPHGVYRRSTWLRTTTRTSTSTWSTADRPGAPPYRPRCTA